MRKFFRRLCGFFVSSLRSRSAQRPVEALCDDLEPRVLFSGAPVEPEDPQAAAETPMEEGTIGDQTGSDQNPDYAYHAPSYEDLGSLSVTLAPASVRRAIR